jgi:hypothetical protein
MSFASRRGIARSYHDRLMVFDVMQKDRTAIRLYKMMGCEQIGTTEHDAGDGSSHPAVVCVAASGRLDTSIERD